MDNYIPNIVMFANLAIYNIAIAKLLSLGLSKINLADVLSEKNFSPTTTATPQAGMAFSAQSTNDVSSYSRWAGFIGATVMATFFWSLGNIILYKAFSSIAEIRDLLSSLTTYFFAGSALFVPYAFNQLRAAFS